MIRFAFFRSSFFGANHTWAKYIFEATLGDGKRPSCAEAWHTTADELESGCSVLMGTDVQDATASRHLNTAFSFPIFQADPT